MRYLLHICFVALFFFGLMPAQTPQYWGRSIINERTSTDATREIDLTDVAQRDILIGGLAVKNKSPEELKSRGSVIVIEGHQNDDGTFWPTAELQAQKEKGDQWTTVGVSGNGPPITQLKIYTGTIVDGLRINLDPFKPLLGKFRFGRIVLKSGDEAEFLLDDLTPPK